MTFESETKIKPIRSVSQRCGGRFSFGVVLTEAHQFDEAGLHPAMLNNVKLCGYKTPTPIQAYVLPSVFKNVDIIGIAQTGE